MNISPISPVSPSIERVKKILFQPFDLGRWLIIGLCAWLAALGSSPGPGAFFRFGGRHRQMDLEAAFEQARDFFHTNMSWLIPLMIGIGIVGIGLWVVLTWLSSRGHFMLLDCVAANKAAVAEPWSKCARQGNSLFFFRVVLGLATSLLMLPFLWILFQSIDGLINGTNQIGQMTLRLVFLGSGAAAIALVMKLIRKATVDFVVPIMFLRETTCWAGWGQFLSLLSERMGSFVLYFLFSVVLALAVRVLVLVVVLVTCCLAGCLLAVPYIGAVVLLPITIFMRSYSLEYLAQFGPEYNVFTFPA